MIKTNLVVTSDFTKQLNKIVKQFKKDSVLIGIPEDKTDRKPDPTVKNDINNATLLAINEFGSPAQNIPSRHPMRTGIKLAKNQITEQFKLCAQEVLKSGDVVIDKYFSRAGIIASNSVKNVINQQINMDGPSKATLAARKRKGFMGENALIVTGQMRNAITWVLGGKK